MKKLQIMLLALFAVSALGAVLVASASAEETLLAEWLVGGAAVTALLPIEATGGITLRDTETIAGSAAVLCEGTFDGSIGPNGEDETTEILNLAKEKIGTLPAGLALLCSTVQTCAAATEASPIEVWPFGLPILSLLFLMVTTNTILNLLYTEVADAEGHLWFGYELLCLVLGINTEDKCWLEDAEVEVINDADTGDAAFPALAVTPNAICSQSNQKATGENTPDALTSILDTDGVSLITVSSEGFG